MALTIRRRRGLEHVLKLEQEKDAVGQCWSPCSTTFSPDEKLLAVMWNQSADLFRATARQIRIYDTTTWKELSRIELAQPRRWDMDRWDDQALRFKSLFIDDQLNQRTGEVVIIEAYYAVEYIDIPSRVLRNSIAISELFALQS